MSISFHQRNPSPLEFLSKSLGQGLGAGIGEHLQYARQHKEEERQKAIQAKEIGSLQERLKSLGPDASPLDKFAAISASSASEKTKEALREALRFEGAKTFAQKVRDNEENLSIADILEGQSLGFIPPGSGQELLRTIGGTREREGAAKIYTPSFQAGQESGKKAREGIATVRRQRELLKDKKHWGPLDLDNLLSKFGLPGAASPQAQEFQAATLGYLTGEKARFGVRLSDADLRLIQNKLPDLARTKEGNEAILNLKESEYLFHKLESEAQQKVLKENKGFTYDFQEKVDQELERLLSQNPNIERLYTQSAETLKKLSGKKEEEQVEDFSFQTLPPASQHEGEYFEDEKGQVYKSNGRTWKKQ
jgi:hypothetical protein